MGDGSYEISWGVSPMNHGLYDSIPTPCIMDRTTIYPPHGPWAVRCLKEDTYPMDHGLYATSTGIHTPWIMGRTLP